MVPLATCRNHPLGTKRIARELARAPEHLTTRALHRKAGEAMDRIFRDQADYHEARKRLDFRRVTIHTASGKVGKLDGALRALMGEMFLENLAIHTRRGHDGVVRDGQ